MSLIAEEGNKGTNFEPVAEGMHDAVCVWVVDIGEQYSQYYDKYQNKVIITWEIPGETIEIDGVELPRVISNTYTVSLGDKANLRKDLQSWRGKSFTQKELAGFDISNLRGVPAMLQVIHKVDGDKTYANITSVLPLKKKIKPITETVVFDIDEWDRDEGSLPEALPEWITKKVMESSQANSATSESDPVGGEVEDASDVPF